MTSKSIRVAFLLLILLFAFPAAFADVYNAPVVEVNKIERSGIDWDVKFSTLTAERRLESRPSLGQINRSFQAGDEIYLNARVHDDVLATALFTYVPIDVPFASIYFDSSNSFKVYVRKFPIEALFPGPEDWEYVTRVSINSEDRAISFEDSTLIGIDTELENSRINVLFAGFNKSEDYQSKVSKTLAPLLGYLKKLISPAIAADEVAFEAYYCSKNSTEAVDDVKVVFESEDYVYVCIKYPDESKPQKAAYLINHYNKQNSTTTSIMDTTDYLDFPNPFRVWIPVKGRTNEKVLEDGKVIFNQRPAFPLGEHKLFVLAHYPDSYTEPVVVKDKSGKDYFTVVTELPSEPSEPRVEPPEPAGDSIVKILSQIAKNFVDSLFK